MIVHVHATYCNFIFFMQMEMPTMVIFVVKRYAVREAKTWRYAVRKVKIGRYAVRKGGGGVTLVLILLQPCYLAIICCDCHSVFCCIWINKFVFFFNFLDLIFLQDSILVQHVGPSIQFSHPFLYAVLHFLTLMIIDHHLPFGLQKPGVFSLVPFCLNIENTFSCAYIVNTVA